MCVRMCVCGCVCGCVYKHSYVCVHVTVCTCAHMNVHLQQNRAIEVEILGKLEWNCSLIYTQQTKALSTKTLFNNEAIVCQFTNYIYIYIFFF